MSQATDSLKYLARPYIVVPTSDNRFAIYAGYSLTYNGIEYLCTVDDLNEFFACAFEAEYERNNQLKQED